MITTEKRATSGNWALILGGSRGLGLASAKKLAAHGYNLFIVHRDRKADMPGINKDFEQIRNLGTRCITYNSDALNPDKRKDLLEQMAKELGAEGKIKVLLHSIAKGNVKPMAGDGSRLSHADFMITLDAMAVSFYDWTQSLIEAAVISGDARVIAFTSEGNTKAIANYGAVAAAKAALESISRNMAVELAPLGITVNCLQAGVTETASFARIPDSEKIREQALRRNPSGRLTKATDVANAVYLLTLDEAKWITGTVIKVDGGESLR